MNYGLWIKNYRTAHKLSQVEFAELTHINQSQISFYERNRLSPSRDVSQKIADGTHIPLNQFYAEVAALGG